jgi:mercuric ion transport protein
MVETHATSPSGRTPETAGWLAAGGLFAGVLASSCCILPLALLSLGVSGAWIGQLTALAPYQPLFLAMALVAVGFGFWRIYGPPARRCASDGACARGPGAATRAGLWLATLLVGAAVAVDLVVPLFV